jgi:hypothetical protein
MTNAPITPFIGKSKSLLARIGLIAIAAAVVWVLLFGNVFRLFRNPATAPDMSAISRVERC